MRYLTLILALGALIGLNACAKDDSAPAQAPQKPVVLKPLPECTPELEVVMHFPQTPNVFKYKIYVGNSISYTKDFSAAGSAQDYTYLIKNRNQPYFFKVERIMKNGSLANAYFDFFVPDCASREAWQKSQTDYEEPIQIDVFN